MRSFIATIFIFLLMCTMIFFNNRYVKECSDYILETIDPQKFYTAPVLYAENLEVFWEENKSFLGLSIASSELERISDLIIELKAFVNFENFQEVEHLRLLISDSADDLSRLERFEIENLL